MAEQNILNGNQKQLEQIIGDMKEHNSKKERLEKLSESVKDISKELDNSQKEKQNETDSKIKASIDAICDGYDKSINADKEKIKMVKTFNANKIQVLTKIVIPSNIPTFFNTLKVNIGLSLVGVISGEFLVSKGGLGYLIVYGGQVFQLDLVMTSVIILAVVAALMYESIVILEKKIVK